MKAPEFAKLARRLARKRRDEDEWPLTGMVFTIAPSKRHPRRLAYATKPSALQGGIHLTELAPADTTCVFRYGITSSPEWARLGTERELGAAVLSFIGDLDPLDLAAFASLVAGKATHGLKLLHVGVDDEWVRLCRSFVKERASRCEPGLPTIKMSAFEVATYRGLVALPGALPVNVAVESRTLLDAGHKLEIEGASNPAFYRAGFSDALAKMLRRRLARAA